MTAIARRARMAGALLLAETRATVRDTAGMIVPLALPAALLLANAMVPTAREVVTPSGHTVLDAFLLPMTMAMVASMVAVVNMPSFLATYRRTGVLETLRVTPVRPMGVLWAQVGVSLVQLLLGIAVMLAIGALGLGVRGPVDALLVAGAVAAGIAAHYGVGMLVSIVSPTPNASVAIGLVCFLGMGAVGGMFGPVDALPEPVRAIGTSLPYGAMLQSVQAAWVGQQPQVAPLLALAAWTVVGVVVVALWSRRR